MTRGSSSNRCSRSSTCRCAAMAGAVLMNPPPGRGRVPLLVGVTTRSGGAGFCTADPPTRSMMALVLRPQSDTSRPAARAAALASVREGREDPHDLVGAPFRVSAGVERPPYENTSTKAPSGSISMDASPRLRQAERAAASANVHTTCSGSSASASSTPLTAPASSALAFSRRSHALTSAADAMTCPRAGSSAIRMSLRLAMCLPTVTLRREPTRGPPVRESTQEHIWERTAPLVPHRARGCMPRQCPRLDRGSAALEALERCRYSDSSG